MKIKLDVEGLKRQIDGKVKQRILAGVEEGLKDIEDYVADRFEYYINKEVYSVYDPVLYERTFKLLNSVDSNVNGRTLKVFVNPSGLELTKEGYPYVLRVFGGHNRIPYDHPKDGAAFMDARDPVNPLVMEITGHMEQEGVIKRKLIHAINKHL